MKTKIISLLKLAGPNGAPEWALRHEYQLKFRVKPGETEFATALQELEEGGFASPSKDKLTGDTYWKLTEGKRK